MEKILTIVVLGAFMFLCIDIVISMTMRIFSNDGYSKWQRHIYGCWEMIIIFLFIQLGWEYIQVVQPIILPQSICTIVPLCFFLIIQFFGLFLCCLTSRKNIAFEDMKYHILPASLLTLGVCILHIHLPQYHFEYLLYGFQVLYYIIVFRILLKNLKQDKIRLNQNYSNLYRRTMTWTSHVVWFFAVLAIVYAYFNLNNNAFNWCHNSLALFIIYFCNYHILEMRDSRLLEMVSDDDEDVSNDDNESKEIMPEPMDEGSSNSENLHKTSLREQTRQRLEENLENICINRRLYLNPDLTVNDLAAELNTNRTYISQYFSDHNTTFLKFINDLRAEYAMYQLKNTNHKLNVVMVDSGFRHTETFRRAFQSRYNCDPKDVTRTTVE